VAIVEDTSITLSELQHRKKLIAYFSNISIAPSQDQQFSKAVLNSMIEDQVLFNYAKKIGISVTEKELETFISNIEQSNKMKPGHLAHEITHRINIPIQELDNKMRAELLRSKIVREMLARDVNITNQDVESLVLTTNFKDANIDLTIITSKDDSDKTYKKMENLKRRIKSCKSIKSLYFKKFAEVSEIQTKLSAINPMTQALVKDLPVDQPSQVVEDNNKLRIFLVCKKEIAEFSVAENDSISNFLGNKKLQIKAQKFFQDLRKKAYVKIML
jgi:hypothetical protein